MAYCSAKISISSGVFSCGRNRVRGGQARGTTQVAAVGGFVHVGRDDVLSLPSNLKISASDRLLTQYELTRLDSRPDDIYYSLRGTPSDVGELFRALRSTTLRDVVPSVWHRIGILFMSECIAVAASRREMSCARGGPEVKSLPLTQIQPLSRGSQKPTAPFFALAPRS